MTWLLTILTGVLAAAIGGGGMLAIANGCVKWYQISSFEGKSGYFMGAMMLLGIVGGLLVGVVAARVGRASLGPAWWAQMGPGVGSVVVLLLVILVLAYFGSDREPELGGRGLIIAWEVRLPASGVLPGPGDGAGSDASVDPADWTDEELRLQVVSVARGRDKQYGSALSTFDRDAFRLEGGQWVLPARVGLFTSKGELCVNLTLGGRSDGFWPTLTTFPRQTDFAWSAWERTNGGRDARSDAEAVMYRWRFERDGGRAGSQQPGP